MFAENTFKDKVVIVTGGGTGIGKEIALAFSRLGAKLVISSRNPEHLEEAKEDYDPEVPVLTITTDIKDSKQVKNLMSETVREYGRIDILINNAGANFLCPAEMISDNGWHSVLEVVLTGTFYCMREAFPYMKKQNFGRIINISSTTAWTGSPYMSHSGASKAGLNNLTKTLAVEWAGYGITVNEVNPGPVFTEGSKDRLWKNKMIIEEVKKGIPTGRFPEAKDVVGSVLFLASSYADSITGASLAIDGGESLRYNPNFNKLLLKND